MEAPLFVSGQKSGGGVTTSALLAGLPVIASGSGSKRSREGWKAEADEAREKGKDRALGTEVSACTVEREVAVGEREGRGCWLDRGIGLDRFGTC